MPESGILVSTGAEAVDQTALNRACPSKHRSRIGRGKAKKVELEGSGAVQLMVYAADKPAKPNLM